MAKIRRNGPCPCGSGSKAKRCCFAIQESAAVHCLPRELCKEWVFDLTGIDKVHLRSLLDQLRNLPEMDTALQRRPRILTPDRDGRIDALHNDDDDEFDPVLDKELPEVDSDERRLELLLAVLTLREQWGIPPKLAAAAVIALVGGESNLFHSWPNPGQSWLATIELLPR